MMIARTLDFEKYFSRLFFSCSAAMCCAVCVTYGSTSKFSRSRRACFPFIVFVSLVLYARDPAMCSDPEKRLASPVIAHRTHKHTHTWHARKKADEKPQQRTLTCEFVQYFLNWWATTSCCHLCCCTLLALCLFHVNPNKVISPTLPPASTVSVCMIIN